MLLNVLVDNHLIQFLLSADLLRFATGKSDRTQVFKKEFAFFELRQQPSKHGQKNPYR